MNRGGPLLCQLGSRSRPKTGRLTNTRFVLWNSEVAILLRTSFTRERVELAQPWKQRVFLISGVLGRASPKYRKAESSARLVSPVAGWSITSPTASSIPRNISTRRWQSDNKPVGFEWRSPPGSKSPRRSHSGRDGQLSSTRELK